MTYFVKYWMDDEATAVTIEGLMAFQAQAQAMQWEVVLDKVTPTEMYFIAYELENNIF